jgi:hypothetical protein
MADVVALEHAEDQVDVVHAVGSLRRASAMTLRRSR